MGAITEKGFIRPTYDELLERQNRRAQEIFGNDMDVSEHSVLGKFIRIGVYDLAALYEELEGVYFARFPGYAEGIQLDRLMPFAGIHRNPAVAAVFKVRLTGQPGAEIQPGFRITGGDGLLFQLEEKVQLGEDGLQVVSVRCAQAGKIGNLPPGSLTKIVNPTAYVHEVEQLEQLVEGREQETDVELRARFELAIGGIGSATSGAVQAAIMRVPGVLGCLILENDSDTVNEAGVPPHGFEAFVLGDTAKDGEIARAIFSKKPLGVKAYGKVEAQVQDTGGNWHKIRFSRVATLALQIRVAVRVNNLFPAKGVELVQNAVAEYLNGFANGRDLVHSALYPVLYSVPGVVDIGVLEISTDGGETFIAGNITVEPSQAVRAGRKDIEVEVLPYVDR